MERNSITRYKRKVYDPVIAQQMSEERIKKDKGDKLDKYKHLRTFVENKLKETWSPEAISGYLKSIQDGVSISHETIYKYSYKVRREWIPFPAGGLQRRRRKDKYGKRTKTLITNRVSIDFRPERVNTRQEFGHFEVDTMVTKKTKETIPVIRERKTGLIKIRKLKRKTAQEVRGVLVSALIHYTSMVKSITYEPSKNEY